MAVVILLAGGAPAEARAEDPAAWTRVAAEAPWRPRDSCGEAVFRGRMWLLGGWFDSYSSPPRDVWSSADGRTWEREAEEAPWKHGDFPMTVVFDDQLWLMGGWYNGRLEDHSASNEVWATRDGREWRRVAEHAGWSPRIAGGLVAFQGRMWLLGGTEDYYFGDAKSLKSDVWSSADGVEWRRETAEAPWSPRAYLGAVAHDGCLWVMGGGNYTPEYHALHDVWRSADGVRWERVTDAAPWSPRLWFSAAVYRERMWVVGGWSKEGDAGTNWGDVWHSRDGAEWTRLEAEPTWKARHEHSTYVFDDQLWVVGGHAQPLSNEVWSLRLPEDFTPEAAR